MNAGGAGPRPPPRLQAVDVVLEAVAAHGVAPEVLGVLHPRPRPPLVAPVHHALGFR